MAHLTLSPGGKRLAFLNVAQGKGVVMVKDLADRVGLLVRLAVGDMKLRYLAWAGEDLLVGVHSQTVNLGQDFGFETEFYNFFAIDCNTGVVSWPLRQPGLLEACLGAVALRQSQGRWRAYCGALGVLRDSRGSNLFDGRGRDLYAFDLDGKDYRLAAALPRDATRWAIDADGSVLAHTRYNAGARRWSLHRGAGDGEPVLTRQEDFGGSGVELGREPGTVVVRLRGDDGEWQPQEVNLNKPNDGPQAGQQTPAFDGRVHRLLHDRITHRWVGAITGPSPGWPMWFDKTRQARSLGVQRSLPGYNLSFGSASHDMGRMVFHSEGADDASTWWLADVQGSGQAVDLGSAYPDIGPKQVGPWQMISYKASDGLAQEGLLTLPPLPPNSPSSLQAGSPAGKPLNKPAVPLPVVVLPHGGPEGHDVAGFDWLAQGLASRGYAVWQPNFRGSSGYGEAFRRAGHGEWGRRMQSDISDGVAELGRLGWTDPQRACIVGASYGGYAALAGVTLQQGLYRCAVSIAGVADLEQLLREARERGGLGSARYLQAYLGAGLSDGETLRALSPAAQAARSNVPVLLIHGRDDSVVPISQSRRMQRALQSAGKSVALLELDGEDHYLSRETTRIATLTAVVAFVQKHNPA